MSAQPVRQKPSPNQRPITLLNPNPYHRLTDSLTLSFPPPYRFLGPSLQLRHPHRRRDGHAERSRYVNITPLLALPSSLQLPTLSALGFLLSITAMTGADISMSCVLVYPAV